MWDSSWDVLGSTTSYSASWDYSDSGRVLSIVNQASEGLASADVFTYPTQGTSSVRPHAAATVGESIVTAAVDDFTSGTYTAGAGLWETATWVETDDDGSATSGLIIAEDGVVKLWGASGVDPEAELSRSVTTTGMDTGTVTIGFAAVGQELEAGDVVTVTLIPDDPQESPITETVTGDNLVVASGPDWEANPYLVEIDLAGVLPADEVTIKIGITAGFDDGSGETLEGVLVTGVEVSMASDVADPDSEGGYLYDAAGRMTSRTTGGVTTTLEWDVLSNLVKTVETGGDTFLYVYDGSGQRVVKVLVDDPETPASADGTATAYLGSTEVTDPDTSTNADLVVDPDALEDDTYVTATRFYTFSGASVAVRDGDTDTLSLLLGDSQGSAQVMMQVSLDANDDMLPASTSDPVSRNAYLPYGATRGGDNLTTIDHGWLNQVTDETDTGLIYLNARYYDPVLSRFLSPDPLIAPTDPRSLDPYMYALNNPTLYTDVSGLTPSCGGDGYMSGGYENSQGCWTWAHAHVNYVTGEENGKPIVARGGPGGFLIGFLCLGPAQLFIGVTTIVTHPIESLEAFGYMTEHPDEAFSAIVDHYGTLADEAGGWQAAGAGAFDLFVLASTWKNAAGKRLKDAAPAPEAAPAAVPKTPGEILKENVSKGRTAEERVSAETGIPRNVGAGRESIPGTGPGGTRFPDLIPSQTLKLLNAIVEVKDWARIYATPQIRNYITYVENNPGIILKIFTNAEAPSRGALYNAIVKGIVKLESIP